MALRAVLFDLDGTLLPMELDVFVKNYVGAIAAWMAPLGRDPERFTKVIWEATGAMMKNDGSRTNEQVFWDRYCAAFGPEARADEPVFERYYAEKYDELRALCGFLPEAAATVRAIKDLGLRVVLATNPLFPACCTGRRLSWTGLEPGEFELITTYENSSFCKPDPRYFREILDKLGLEPEECLMVGNDAYEDACCMELGLPLFLLPAYLLNRKNADISGWPQGDLRDLLDHIKERIK